METVEGNHRLGKAGADNLVHAVREVKRHFFNQQTDKFRYFLQNACDLLRLRPLYNGYKTSLASMGFFVGQYGVHLTGRQTRFIYAQMSAHVLWNYYPVLGMVCVLPGLESADSFLV